MIFNKFLFQTSIKNIKYIKQKYLIKFQNPKITSNLTLKNLIEHSFLINTKNLEMIYDR